MSQLYTSQSTVDKLLTIFSSLFPAATRPTRHLLAWLLIAQLALESAPSVRCLFRQFLSKQTDASLNSYYRALGNGLVTDASIRIPFYRISDFSNFGLTQPDIYLDESKYKNYLMPEKDTVLLSKDGSVCIAYKVDEDLYGITSSALLHLKVTNTDVLPDYLALVLNSSIVRLQAEQAAGGSIIQHWRMDDIKNVMIPVIDKNIQEDIAKKVQESFRLRNDSTHLLTFAKRAIELAIEHDEESAIAYLESKKN